MNFFFKRVCNGSYAVKNSFEFQNKLNWVVQSYSVDLYHFCRKSPKNTVIWKKVAISEICSEMSDFFLQIRETGNILPKTVLRLKLNHI